ncbi:hypothetical protein [Streptomyces sp. NPDC005385]
MTEYDPASARCRPSAAGHALRAGARAARLVARAAGAGAQRADSATA